MSVSDEVTGSTISIVRCRTTGWCFGAFFIFLGFVAFGVVVALNT